MTTANTQKSIASQNLAAHAAEAAKQLGLPQSPTDSNSQAEVIKFGDIAQQSNQAEQPAQSSTASTSENAKSEDRTCDATDGFARLVTAAITLGSGSREKSRQALHADYVAAHAYENAGDHKEAYKERTRPRSKSSALTPSPRSR
ncbi:hypothetical protein [Paraburkholderia sp. UCT2]|uniref:hypothetical protein n=1 Tax=Paraburkholderia sp. UCT2 TaxID=2615208 RepID=UPI0016563E9C|nr:hypothetical protein [Paraburkholderia sp. UCT2]MBC8733450.1 hypothetical protein [Paraburkholderia sp. UCT2]